MRAFVLTCFLAVLSAGCSAGSTPVAAPNPQDSVVNPVIQVITPKPTSVAHRTDAMTFAVTATAPDGAALDYTWSATKGNLPATKGQMIWWTPQKADGSLEDGPATIEVVASNGKGGTSRASITVQIAADGSATQP